MIQLSRCDKEVHGVCRCEKLACSSPICALVPSVCIHTFIHTVNLPPISFHPYILQLYIFPPTLITFKTSWFLKLNSNLGWSILNLGGMRPAGASDILLSFYFCNIDVVVGRKSRQCCAHEQENAHQQISCENLHGTHAEHYFVAKLAV